MKIIFLLASCVSIASAAILHAPSTFDESTAVDGVDVRLYLGGLESNLTPDDMVIVDKLLVDSYNQVFSSSIGHRSLARPRSNGFKFSKYKSRLRWNKMNTINNRASSMVNQRWNNPHERGTPEWQIREDKNRRWETDNKFRQNNPSVRGETSNSAAVSSSNAKAMMERFWAFVKLKQAERSAGVPLNYDPERFCSFDDKTGKMNCAYMDFHDNVGKDTACKLNCEQVEFWGDQWCGLLNRSGPWTAENCECNPYDEKYLFDEHRTKCIEHCTRYSHTGVPNTVEQAFWAIKNCGKCQHDHCIRYEGYPRRLVMTQIGDADMFDEDHVAGVQDTFSDTFCTKLKAVNSTKLSGADECHIALPASLDCSSRLEAILTVHGTDDFAAQDDHQEIADAVSAAFNEAMASSGVTMRNTAVRFDSNTDGARVVAVTFDQSCADTTKSPPSLMEARLSVGARVCDILRESGSITGDETCTVSFFQKSE